MEKALIPLGLGLGLLAQAPVDAIPIVGGITSVGAVGVLSYIAYYVICKYLPARDEKEREAREKKEALDAAARKEREDKIDAAFERKDRAFIEALSSQTIIIKDNGNKCDQKHTEHMQGLEHLRSAVQSHTDKS